VKHTNNVKSKLRRLRRASSLAQARTDERLP
jgi:hypothetical protein